MLKVILGGKGSGNTKELVAKIGETLKDDRGSLVCIEKDNDLRYDVNYRVRLISAGEYGINDYAFFKGFISGLYGGNFDISHIFIDGLYKITGTKDTAACEEFLAWCEAFGAARGVNFTITLSEDPATASEGIKKYA